MPFVYNPGDGVQRGLPGVVAAEEDALPSERVLSGELLGERRREALAGLRAALGDRPDGFMPEEWAVVVAVLSPPTAAPGHHLGGQKARSALTVRARDCFPGFPAHAALRAFREVQTRPHVAEVIADFRALEAVDVVEQRAMLREALGAVIALATREGPGESLGDLLAIDANAAAKVSAAVTAAAKTLMDLDGLKTPPAGRGSPALGVGRDDGDTGTSDKDKDKDDPRDALAKKLAVVFGDVDARMIDAEVRD
ncbi:MAG: hypothetical protein NTZ64_02830 [Polaromonas sp.]|nr:hypothetical protein [Polaromonas sp.]